MLQGAVLALIDVKPYNLQTCLSQGPARDADEAAHRRSLARRRSPAGRDGARLSDWLWCNAIVVGAADDLVRSVSS